MRLERYAVRLGAYAADVIATSIRAEEARSHARHRGDVALTKSRLCLLVVATTGAGAFLASPAGPGWTTASVAIFVSCIGVYTVKRWVVRGRG